MAPVSYSGAWRTTEMVHKPLADFRQSSTITRPHHLGIFFSYHFGPMSCESITARVLANILYSVRTLKIVYLFLVSYYFAVLQARNSICLKHL